MRKKKNKSIVLMILVLFLLYSILMFTMTGGLCMFRGILGLPCPACGSTRAIIHLAKGDVTGCMELNPSAPLLFLCLLNEIRVNYFSKGDKRIAGILLTGSISFSIIIYIIRMKMYFPFKAPYVFDEHCLLIQLLKALKN